jgi:hypothetical protein
MKGNARTCLLTAATALFAVGAAATSRVGVSPALLPRAEPVLRDVHASHPAGNPPCATCHPKASGSSWASERLAPAMADCAPCHPAVKGATALSPVTAACRTCHAAFAADGAPLPSPHPRPNIRFSHRAHAPQPCAACHPDAAAGRRSEDGFDAVGMRTCFACHAARGRRLSECRTCHLVRADGRMVTLVNGELLTPPDWLLGPSHGASWNGTHAAAAGARSELCAQCHDDAFCTRCHGGALRPRDVHPGDWLAAHGASTRLDNPHCRSCHRSQSFCLDCHRRSGVAIDSPEGARPEGTASPHGDASPAQICRRAKYDIQACVSCHSERSCVTCHASIDPHPAGFQKRCKALARRNQRACEKCHSDGVWRRCE